MAVSIDRRLFGDVEVFVAVREIGWDLGTAPLIDERARRHEVQIACRRITNCGSIARSALAE